MDTDDEADDFDGDDDDAEPGAPGSADSVTEGLPFDTDAEDVEPNRRSAATKVKSFPTGPGVYLMKDGAGRVIYVGKAKNLRARASSYFLRAAAEDRRTAELVREIRDIDYLEAESEVDALLMESRLVKDVQPRFNSDLKDDKTFPYLQITTHEDYPRVEFTRTPRHKGVKLYGPFTSAGSLRGAIVVLQRIFKFRTCTLDIDAADPQWRWFRPCLLASIGQCTAPCNLRITKEDYRADINRLKTFLDGGKRKLIEEMKTEMLAASGRLEFERAARLRDEIKLLETLDQRGDLEEHVQPEVFLVDPKKGLAGLQKVLGLAAPPRVIEGVDIAHLHGNETVASLVQFIDGLPFKAGYKRFRIKGVEGIDDFRSIHEVVSRRFSRLVREGASLPDVFLVDGGKGQLSAAMAALDQLGIEAPCVISLAKREEEVFLPGKSEPLRISRDAWSLRLLEYVRDEAHRFAQHYHHFLRHKRTFEE